MERSRDKENRKFILGQIVFIDNYTATADYCPYPIPLGTLFHVCHCEPLKAVKKGTASASAAEVVATAATTSAVASTSRAAVGEGTSGGVDGPFSAPR